MSDIKKPATRFTPGLSTAFFLACLIFPLHAQTPADKHLQLRQAMDRGDTQDAWTQLQALRGSLSPELFAVNNYDYLAGRLALQRGDTAQANASFQAVAARNSALAGYALWHLSESARLTGNLPQERLYLRQLVGLPGSARLRSPARTRLARSFFESQDYPSAIATLKPLAGDPKDAAARPLLSLLAEAQLANGQAEEARASFASLLANLPNPSQPDDYALGAARVLDKLDGEPTEANKLPETEHLRRAQVYQFNRDFAAARRHWAAIINFYPQSAVRSNALFQTGRGLGSEGNYAAAVTNYQKIM